MKKRCYWDVKKEKIMTGRELALWTLGVIVIALALAWAHAL
jgi:hypothetical protein